jgi:hypothetical protein
MEPRGSGGRVLDTSFLGHLKDWTLASCVSGLHGAQEVSRVQLSTWTETLACSFPLL